MTLLSILHRQQSQEADCLAACTQIVLHYFAEAPKEVQREEFLLAWLEQDYWYAVIRLVNV